CARDVFGAGFDYW
nr:immunoglobulin heavy chain junction region [Macaca mulatta]MOW76144.1 immunoglobulin heavy chain junction region [Macaca mulatta]MOW77988.1 immunoglobulin heavy chain junction region [Macaca mulatta]MOW80590.1 immunoglobulin heavy chain junction region [Macaca mulatta]MOW80869.1 immunoglobulin heavy chain junction region [Macaca mulatta]